MKQYIKIDGMTCASCKTQVAAHLKKIPNVKEVHINLERKEALIHSNSKISRVHLKSVLPQKYKIMNEGHTTEASQLKEESLWKKLQPLFLILFYISTASVLMNRKHLDFSEMMLDYMGLFFIVFSFFKILDLKGFSASFKMYDPIANKVQVYGIMYPFLETLLGLFFLMRIQVLISLIGAIIILGTTTIGVIKALSSQREIRCACLGTVLNLPMTQATLIENAVMLVMAVVMLFNHF